MPIPSPLLDETKSHKAPEKNKIFEMADDEDMFEDELQDKKLEEYQVMMGHQTSANHLFSTLFQTYKVSKTIKNLDSQ